MSRFPRYTDVFLFSRYLYSYPPLFFPGFPFLVLHPISPPTGLENEDMTPTLKQLWVTVRQLQQDMTHAKNQINEERALRSHLQQLLIGHLEATTSSGAATAAATSSATATVTTSVCSPGAANHISWAAIVLVFIRSYSKMVFIRENNRSTLCSFLNWG